MVSKIESEGFTFDDVLIRPAASAMEPAEASLQTNIGGIILTVPFLSAAMDRVTEEEMAIALGRLGGLGCPSARSRERDCPVRCGDGDVRSWGVGLGSGRWSVIKPRPLVALIDPIRYQHPESRRVLY